MKSLRVLALLLAAFLAAAPALAQSDLPDRIQARYETLRTFRAEFTQDLTNAASGEVSTRTGTISFENPSLVRWETISPDPELLVVGVDAVWDYFPDEQLAIRYAVDQLFDSKTMIRFLSGQANLRDDFSIEIQEVEDGLVKIKLIPFEPEPGLVLGYIWVDEETALIHKVLVVDFFANGNMVSLEHMEVDVSLRMREFEFEPPEGVDVEDNTAM